MDEQEIQKTIRIKQRAHRKARKTAKKQDRDRYRRLQQEVLFSIRRSNKEYICMMQSTTSRKSQEVLTERAHFIWLVMIKMPFFTSEQPKRYKLWSCQKMCVALHYLLDNIFIRFGSKLYRQIVGIPMGTNCAPLVSDLFLFCYGRKLYVVSVRQ